MLLDISLPKPRRVQHGSHRSGKHDIRLNRSSRTLHPRETKPHRPRGLHRPVHSRMGSTILSYIAVWSWLLALVLILPTSFGATEVLFRGFDGVSAVNPSGTLVWDDSIMRSTAISDENLFFAYDMSTVTVERDLFDFSAQENHASMDAGNFTDSFQTNLTATDDAYTREVLPDQVNGAGTSFDVSASSTGSRERGWVLWDLTGLPSDANITSAVVWMRGTSTALVWLRADNALATWDETTITWNLEPSAGPPEYNGQQSASPYWTAWDITPLAQQWQDGITSNFGLRFRVCRTNADGPTGTCRESLFNVGTNWFSSEHGTPGNRPGLLLDYTANATQDFIELVPSYFGQGRNFDGIDDTITANLATTPNTTFTWGIWFTKSRDDVTEYLLLIEGDSLIAMDSNNKPTCLVVATQITADERVFAGELTGVFCRLDGGTPNTLQMWVNGVEQSDNATFSDVLFGEVLHVSPLVIGNPFPFEGTVDEAVGFLDAKSDSEMVDLSTPQSQIVIGGGIGIIDTQAQGLIDALPWLIVVGLFGFLAYILVAEFRKSME